MTNAQRFKNAEARLAKLEKAVEALQAPKAEEFVPTDAEIEAGKNWATEQERRAAAGEPIIVGGVDLRFGQPIGVEIPAEAAERLRLWRIAVGDL